MYRPILYRSKSREKGFGDARHKLAEAIHPRHERIVENNRNLHDSFIMMSRVRDLLGKDKAEAKPVGAGSRARVSQWDRSRIEPVFSYTINAKINF